ncbi:hypothetical protein [Streptomyces sp. NPDC007264]|uniref:hypothetical protein n=1 Tax=Streptomyces sp. NPDC007264 TaxID=3364777 RepID=UPI0036D84029
MHQLEFGLWSALIGVSLAIWVAVAGVAGQALLDRWRPARFRPGGRALAVLGTGMLTFNAVIFSSLRFFLRSTSHSQSAPVPLDGIVWRMTVLVVLGQLCALPALLGLWDVQARLVELARNRRMPGTTVTVTAPTSAPLPTDVPADGLRTLERLWKDTMKYLTCAALIISTAVINTGALRNSLLAHEKRTPGFDVDFPAGHVLLYGAFFSVLVAMIFLPVMLQWRAMAHRLVETAFPLPSPDRLTPEWLERRSALVSFLRLDLSLSKLLSPALGILAPLGTSALSLVLPGS